jgi:hypothetical protein
MTLPALTTKRSQILKRPLSIQGVPDPDDPARLDDQEESDLKKAMALSIQGEEERQQQQLSDLEEFQSREAKQFKDKPAHDDATHGGLVVMPARTEGSGLQRNPTKVSNSLRHPKPMVFLTLRNRRGRRDCKLHQVKSGPPRVPRLNRVAPDPTYGKT